MNEQNTNQTETQSTQQPMPQQQPIIINNMVADQPDDRGKRKAPGFLKVCIYSVLTGGLYFFYWLVKSVNGGYRKR